jgi:hypothetical protein
MEAVCQDGRGLNREGNRREFRLYQPPEKRPRTIEEMNGTSKEGLFSFLVGEKRAQPSANARCWFSPQIVLVLVVVLVLGLRSLLV